MQNPNEQDLSALGTHQLAAAERMFRQHPDAVAELAGGIAHQFNNALFGIIGNMELLKMDFPGQEILDPYIEPMRASVQRMLDLTNQLLAYARGGKVNPQPVVISEIIEEDLRSLPYSMNPSVRLKTDIPDDIWKVDGDPRQIRMALSAVILNAAEAIDENGSIGIQAHNIEIIEETAHLNSGLDPGAYICLDIRDNGKGMDEETQKRIFDPFFTTKFQGRGLGMAAAYGIVKNHGGEIMINSEAGSGTLVRIYLPAVVSDPFHRKK